MEDFNKNWLIILLVAVIFGTLGFLVGRTTGNDQHQQLRWGHSDTKDKFDIQVEVEEENGEETIMKMDTIMKDGKQIIIKEVKKIKKK